MASPIPAAGPFWLHWVGPGARPLGDAIADAVARAQIAGAWSGPEIGKLPEITKGSYTEDPRIADFRALVFGCMWLFDEMSLTGAAVRSWGPGETAVPYLTSDRTLIEVSPRGIEAFSSPERFGWMKVATQRSWSLLFDRLALVGVPELGSLPTRVGTLAGQVILINLDGWKGSGSPPEAGAAWVLPAIGMVLGAATVCFVVDRGALIIDRILARHADAAALIATQAKVMSVLNEHRDAEKAAGKELPLSSSETDVLKLLQGLQDGFSKRNSAGGPFPSAVPSGTEVASSVSWGVLVAGAAIVALMLLRK